MTRATQAALGTVLDIAGVVLLVSIGFTMAVAVVARMLRRATAPQGPHTRVPGVLVLGYRHCPHEHRDRAAVIRTDGTAHCLDCGTTIPAPEARRA